jgi:hypothetical protein
MNDAIGFRLVEALSSPSPQHKEHAARRSQQPRGRFGNGGAGFDEHPG